MFSTARYPSNDDSLEREVQDEEKKWNHSV